jgi:16S rRNA (adenine(1408)-N(1))-methyltransferase
MTVWRYVDMEIMKGKTTIEISSDEFSSIISGYPRISVDMGCGDGKYPYEMARLDPNTFYIGIDADRNGLTEYSRRISKKPEKGGATNVIFLIANIENLPEDLHRIADEVTVILPWGSLLRGLVNSDPKYLEGIRFVGKEGSKVRIYLNYNVKYEPVEMERQGLPELTEEYIQDVLGPAYSSHGIIFHSHRFMENEEARSLPSTWARRLGFGRVRSTLLLEGTVGGDPL